MSKVLTFLTLSLLVLIHFMAPPVVALDTDGLVGVWLLDEGKGEAVKDPSGNGLDGKNELIEDGMVVTLDVQPGGKLVTTWSQIKARSAR